MTDRWKPKDLDELRSFVANGLGESRFLEFKRQLPSKNRDVARQLAGLAVNGGSFVIGVDETEDGRFSVAPVAHKGLAEKAGQIAQSLVDPPLVIDSQVLADRDDPSRGVLWIIVPSSPEAPHQVEGVYYERCDTRTQPMSDATVERLMSARRKSIEEIRSKLEKWMENDPISNRQTVHVFGIAEPVGAGPEDLYKEVGDDNDGWRAFCEEARKISADYPPVPGESSPGAYRPWYQLLDPYPSWDSGPTDYTVYYGDVDADNDRPVLRISFGDDGTIRYVNNVGSRPITTVGGVSPDEYFLHPGRIMGSCLDVLDAARAVARRTGQRRSWDIGFGLTGTEGLQARGDPQRSYGASRPFLDANYMQPMRVTHQHLEKDVWGVVHKLMRRFLRGCDHKFEQVARELGYIDPENAT